MEISRSDRVGIGAAVVGGIILGVLIAVGAARPAAAIVVLGLATLIGVLSWRLAVVLALAYLPVQGLLWVALYPHTAPAALAKDFLFVIPAYIGFFYWCIKSKRNFVFPGFPLLAVVLLAGLVIAEIFNPLLDSLLVGLVGAKVWLFYIPMAFLGYQLVRSRSDLDRLLKIICLTAIIPAVVGIAEAILYYTGHSHFVYSLYGSAASAATQGFAAISVGGAGFRRVPSTFSFVAQYYIFMTSMVAFGYAWWRRAATASWSRRWRLAVWLLFLAAALTSGARGALPFVPLLLVAILLIDGRLGFSSIGLFAALAAGLVLMIALVGASATGTVSDLVTNARVQLHTVFITGLREASHHVLLGTGTGSDTNAARYVSGSFSATGGWQESYSGQIDPRARNRRPGADRDRLRQHHCARPSDPPRTSRPGADRHGERHSRPDDLGDRVHGQGPVPRLRSAQPVLLALHGSPLQARCPRPCGGRSAGTATGGEIRSTSRVSR